MVRGFFKFVLFQTHLNAYQVSLARILIARMAGFTIFHFRAQVVIKFT